eukprot:4906899-Alexandrium_andersonii.AAC.1
MGQQTNRRSCSGLAARRPLAAHRGGLGPPKRRRPCRAPPHLHQRRWPPRRGPHVRRPAGWTERQSRHDKHAQR